MQSFVRDEGPRGTPIPSAATLPLKQPVKCCDKAALFPSPHSATHITCAIAYLSPVLHGWRINTAGAVELLLHQGLVDFPHEHTQALGLGL